MMDVSPFGGGGGMFRTPAAPTMKSRKQHAERWGQDRKPLAMDGFFESLVRNEEEMERKKQPKPLPEHMETRWAKQARLERERSTVNGDVIRKRFWEALAAFEERGYRLTPMQRTVVTAFLGSCQRVMYRHDFYDRVVQIMDELGVEDLRQEVMVTAVRRFGKTWAVAIFCAALLHSVPDIEVSIFSTGRRASKKLLFTIKRFIGMLPKMDETNWSSNEETMWIQGTEGKNDKRILNSYPSKVEIEGFLSSRSLAKKIQKKFLESGNFF